MEQLRLIDDRIALLVEEKECFKVVNMEEIKTNETTNLYSSGKGFGDKKHFEEEIMKCYGLREGQLKWIPFMDLSGRLKL